VSAVDDLEKLFAGHKASIGFTRTNDAIPGDLRIAWRLAVLCLMLARFRGKRGRIEHLHTLWWAIRSDESRQLVVRWFDRRPSPDEIIVRFDPSLTATIDLAVGQELIEQQPNGMIKLSPTGQALAETIWNQDGVLLMEKQFLGQLPPSISQKAMKDMTEWR
jgi:hypothetical protein